MGLFTAIKTRRQLKMVTAASTPTAYGLENDSHSVEFSKLEATLVKDEVERRPISRDGQVAMRHAESADLDVNELDHDYDVDVDQYPYRMLDSAQELFAGVLYHEHLNKPENFSKETKMECFSIQASGAKWLKLD